MDCLIIGCGGYLGSATARSLSAAGHGVIAAARAEDREIHFREAGYGVAKVDLANVSTLERAIEAVDAVFFTPSIPPEEEARIIPRVVAAVERLGKSLLFMSGAFQMARPTPQGEWCEDTYSEFDEFELSPVMAVRGSSEFEILEAGRRGARTMIVRPPMVWGHGAGMQIPMMIDAARRNGAAHYLGRGLNVWSNVHVDDVGDLCRLALEAGQPGAVYHAVSGELDIRSTARAIGALLSLPASSIDIGKAEELFTPTGASILLGHSCRIKAPRSKAELGWKPLRFDPLEDILSGSYRGLVDG